MTADAAVERGSIVDSWDSEDRRSVAEYLPYFGSTANPIDLTGAMINDVSILVRTLEVIIANDETDVVLVVVGNAESVADEIVAAVTAAYAATAKPLHGRLDRRQWTSA